MVNKKLWLGMLVMVLMFGMIVIGCDNGSTSEDDMLTYLTTVNTSPEEPLSGRMPRAPQTTYTMEELFAGGRTEMVYRLNINPDPAWLVGKMPNEIIITNIPTDAQYVVFLQAIKNQTYPPNITGDESNRDKMYYDCYDYNNTKKRFEHIEGKNWYGFLYDQVNHIAYGDDHTSFITPDLGSFMIILD